MAASSARRRATSPSRHLTDVIAIVPLFTAKSRTTRRIRTAGRSSLPLSFAVLPRRGPDSHDNGARANPAVERWTVEPTRPTVARTRKTQWKDSGASATCPGWHWRSFSEPVAEAAAVHRSVPALKRAARGQRRCQRLYRRRRPSLRPRLTRLLHPGPARCQRHHPGRAPPAAPLRCRSKVTTVSFAGPRPIPRSTPTWPWWSSPSPRSRLP